MAKISPEVLSDLAPNGTLRVGINFGNELLTKRDPVTRAPSGVQLDLAWELGKRLAVPVEIISYEGAGQLTNGAAKCEWEVAFMAVEPARADKISFTTPYAEIEATYMVPPDSRLAAMADVDGEGVRIASVENSAYDLYLSRTIKHATLVRFKDAYAAFDHFVADRFDALAGLRPVLLKQHSKYPKARILDGRFTAAQQGACTPKGRDAGFSYLNEYINDVRASGLVAHSMAINGVVGVAVVTA